MQADVFGVDRAGDISIRRIFGKGSLQLSCSGKARCVTGPRAILFLALVVCISILCIEWVIALCACPCAERSTRFRLALGQSSILSGQSRALSLRYRELSMCFHRPVSQIPPLMRTKGGQAGKSGVRGCEFIAWWVVISPLIRSSNMCK